MLKRIVTLIFWLGAFCLFAPVAYADEIDDFAAQIGQSAQEGLPEAVQDELSDMDISLEDPQSLAEISVQDIFDTAKESFFDGMVRPLPLLGKLMGILLLCSLASGMSSGTGTEKTCETICVMAVVMLIFDSLSSACTSLIEMLCSLGGFMTSYLPVYVGVTTAGTGVATASGSSIAMLVLSEAVALCANKILPFVCSVIMALSIAQSVSPASDCSIACAIRKVCNKAVAFASTLFVGIISITGIVGASADSVAARCVRFSASSFVPVIGSSVAEAYTTVRGSLSLLRSATGAFGIIAVTLIALGPVLRSVGICVVVLIAKTIAELFSLKAPKAFLGGVGEMMSVILTSSILLSLIFIVSTAVLMISCVNI